MSAPTPSPTWATDANYTGGPAVGTPTKVAPSIDQKAQGYDPADEPTAQELNWLLNLLCVWVVYLASVVGTPTWRRRPALGYLLGNVAVTGVVAVGTGLGAAFPIFSGTVSTDDGIYSIPLDVSVGEKISAISVRIFATFGSNTTTSNIQLQLIRCDGTSAAVVVATNSFIPNTATHADLTIASAAFVVPGDHTVLDNNQYVLQVQFIAGGGPVVVNDVGWQSYIP